MSVQTLNLIRYSLSSTGPGPGPFFGSALNSFVWATVTPHPNEPPYGPPTTAARIPDGHGREGPSTEAAQTYGDRHRGAKAVLHRCSWYIGWEPVGNQ